MSFTSVNLQKSIQQWRGSIDYDLYAKRPYVVVDPLDPEGLLYLSHREYERLLNTSLASNSEVTVIARPGQDEIILKEILRSKAAEASKLSTNSTSSNEDPNQGGTPPGDNNVEEQAPTDHHPSEADGVRPKRQMTMSATLKRFWPKGKGFVRSFRFASRLSTITRGARGELFSSPENYENSFGLLISEWSRLLHHRNGLASRGTRNSTLAVVGYLLGVLKSQGTRRLILVMKTSLYAVITSLGGNPLKNTHHLGLRIKLKHGLPAWLPVDVRHALRARRVQLSRVWISILYSYKALPGPYEAPTYQSVASPTSTYDFTQLTGVINSFWSQLKDFFNLESINFEEDLSFVQNRGFFNVAGSPGRGNSLESAGDAAYHWLHLEELLGQSPLVTWLKGTSQSMVLDLLRQAGDEERRDSNTLGDPRKALGKLHLKLEAAGKVRVFAIVDWWTQVALRPFHDYLFGLLRRIPCDATFDQEGVLHKYVLRGNLTHFAYDLTAATDMIPIGLYRELFKPVIGVSNAEAWAELMNSREFLVPSWNPALSQDPARNPEIIRKLTRLVLSSFFSALSSFDGVTTDDLLAVERFALQSSTYFYNFRLRKLKLPLDLRLVRAEAEDISNHLRRRFLLRGASHIDAFDMQLCTENLMGSWLGVIRSALADREESASNRGYPAQVPPSIRYTRGQPMGALSSWAALAVAHHFLVYLASYRAEGALPNSRRNWFSEYLVLGDDIVISDFSVAKQYEEICSELGIPLNTAKSLISEEGLVNFANRYILNTIDYSPASLKEEREIIDLSGLLERVRRMGLRRGWYWYDHGLETVDSSDGIPIAPVPLTRVIRLAGTPSDWRTDQRFMSRGELSPMTRTLMSALLAPSFSTEISMEGELQSDYESRMSERSQPERTTFDAARANRHALELWARVLDEHRVVGLMAELGRGTTFTRVLRGRLVCLLAGLFLSLERELTRRIEAGNQLNIGVRTDEEEELCFVRTVSRRGQDYEIARAFPHFSRNLETDYRQMIYDKSSEAQWVLNSTPKLGELLTELGSYGFPDGYEGAIIALWRYIKLYFSLLELVPEAQTLRQLCLGDEKELDNNPITRRATQHYALLRLLIEGVARFLESNPGLDTECVLPYSSFSASLAEAVNNDNTALSESEDTEDFCEEALDPEDQEVKPRILAGGYLEEIALRASSNPILNMPKWAAGPYSRLPDEPDENQIPEEYMRYGADDTPDPMGLKSNDSPPNGEEPDDIHKDSK